MVRKEGFIDVGEMLRSSGIDTTSLYNVLGSRLIHIIKDDSTGVHFSFEYEGETYFYKYSFFVRRGSTVDISPYNELIVQELAHDFGISCIPYDLAILAGHKGVLSKNFKKENTEYILGNEILLDFINYYDSSMEDDDFMKKLCQSSELIPSYKYLDNILDDIWDTLEIRYHSNRKIVSNLMKKIVDIYLFDILTCQIDRHAKNWSIMESSGEVDIAPIYDNERIFLDTNENITVCLGVEFPEGRLEEGAYQSIKNFQNVSSEDYKNIILGKLWIIEEENLNKVFERIEAKTEYPIPEEKKKYYLDGYRKHREKLEEILNKENTRKR